MAFAYNHKDAQKPVWPKGDYPAALMTTEEKVSSKGNPMLVLTFEVYNGDKSVQIDDYIVNPSTIYKLKGLAVALGELAAFDADTFNADEFVGANLIVELDIQAGSGGFDDANKIKKYKSKELSPTGTANPEVSAASMLKNAKRNVAGLTSDPDDIPF